MNRGLKNRHLQLISLGGVIGSGYFLGTGHVPRKRGLPRYSPISLGGLSCLRSCSAFAELAWKTCIRVLCHVRQRAYLSDLGLWCGLGLLDLGCMKSIRR